MKQMREWEKRNTVCKKFNLIELLIVIAIIAVLAGLLLPVLHKARLKSGNAKCINNLKQSGTILILYSSDHDGYFPAESWFHNTTADKILYSPVVHHYKSDYYGMGMLQKQKYYTSPKILECPLRQKVSIEGLTEFQYHYDMEYFNEYTWPFLASGFWFVNGNLDFAASEKTVVRPYRLIKGTRVLAMDGISDRHGIRGSNVLYQDGSITFRKIMRTINWGWYYYTQLYNDLDRRKQKTVIF